MTKISWTRNRADAATVLGLLRLCDRDFTPRLSTRVDIEDYADRIVQLAQRMEAWDSGVLVGLVAIYCNAAVGEEAFITNVSVAPDRRRRGIARRLVQEAIKCAEEIGYERIALEVDSSATQALQLYHKTGFTRIDAHGKTMRLIYDLSARP